eukprot:6618250-Prymnesium_polylepis.1
MRRALEPDCGTPAVRFACGSAMGSSSPKDSKMAANDDGVNVVSKAEISLDTLLVTAMSRWSAEADKAAAIEEKRLLKEAERHQQKHNGIIDFNGYTKLLPSTGHALSTVDALAVYSVLQLESQRVRGSRDELSSEGIHPSAFAHAISRLYLSPTSSFYVPVHVDAADAYAPSPLQRHGSQTIAHTTPESVRRRRSSVAGGGFDGEAARRKSHAARRMSTVGSGVPSEGLRKCSSRHSVVAASVASLGDLGEIDERTTSFKQRMEADKESGWELGAVLEALMAHALFKSMSQDALGDVVGLMQRHTYTEGELVIQEGDHGDNFYVLVSGECDAVKSDSITLKERVVGTLHANEADKRCFGELSLIYAKPRSASIVARSQCTIFALSRRHFRNAQRQVRSTDVLGVLRKVSVLESLHLNQLKELKKLVTEQDFDDGDTVVQKGEIGDSLFVIMSGNALVTHDDGPNGDSGASIELQECSYFGERALLKSEPRNATVKAVGKLKCFLLSRQALEKHLGPLQQHLQQEMQQREQQLEEIRRSEDLERLEMSDLLPIGILERTEHGTIELVALRDGAPDRRFTLRRRAEVLFEVETVGQSAMNELRILRKLTLEGKSRGNKVEVGLPQLLRTIKDEASSSICTMFKQRALLPLGALPLPLDLECLQYVGASIALALQELHERHALVHRGISESQVVLNEDGSVMLVDFAFVKPIDVAQLTYTLCGVPESLAPEQ